MFGLFSKRDPNECPIPLSSRDKLEKSFAWLLDSFENSAIKRKTILTPHHHDFPIRYDGTEEPAHATLAIVAGQMEVDPAAIQLDFYNDGNKSLSAGSPWGGKIHLGTYQNIHQTAGLYWGKEEDGKYHIWLEKRKLTQPEALVATLAHEIAHIKLLGEERIAENDEFLTDLTTIIFGLGIFNANAAFRFYSGFDGWAYSKQGYLTQREWGYGLALFARLRGEQAPAWASFLTTNIRSDLSKSLSWLAAQSDTPE